MILNLRKIFSVFVILLSFPLVSYSENIDEYLFDLKMKGYSYNNDGLSEAIIKKNHEDIELFLKAGIDFHSADKEGYTAVQRAEMTKDEETLAFVNDIVKLSDRQKSFLAVNTKNEQLKNDIVENSDNLILFVKTNNIEGVKNSAENNKNLNEFSEEGLAPLHYAVFNNNYEIVKTLLYAGANVNLKSSDGLTPLDIAVLNNQKDIAKIIIECGGGMSSVIAEELNDMGCKIFYDEDNDIYRATYAEACCSMNLIKERLKD